VLLNSNQNMYQASKEQENDEKQKEDENKPK
jgi:hypothetical protein